MPLERDYKGFKIYIRENDGFINATSLCKVGDKKFSNWYRTTEAKVVIRKLRQELKTDASNPVVVETTVGNVSKGSVRGSWIHPRLATCIALWVDPCFALKVSEWIEEWRALNNNNERYIQALKELKPFPTVQAERQVQKRLHRELGGTIEEKTPVGYIDLLTDDQIIEIKEIDNWKQAMGQLLCYANFHPSKQKRLHLFNSADSTDKEIIEDICSKFEIEVTFE